MRDEELYVSRQKVEKTNFYKLLLNYSVFGSKIHSFATVQENHRFWTERRIKDFLRVCRPSFVAELHQKKIAVTMASTIAGLAIIGKNNEPLYFKHFSNDVEEGDLFGLSSSTTTTSPNLKLRFVLHSALDSLEQKSGPPPGYAWRKNKQITGTAAMFVGLLEAEDYAVYGKTTN